MREVGVVIGGQIGYTPHKDGGTVFHIEPTDPNLIRNCLTYWDDVVITSFASMSPLEENETQLLVQQGIVKQKIMIAESLRPFSVLTNSEWSKRVEDVVRQVDYFVTKTPYEAVKELNIFEPGKWALAIQSEKLPIPAGIEEKETKSVFAELHRALPIPASKTPIVEILEFKSRRQSELLEFRHAMDGLYRTISNDPDLEISKQWAKDEIEISLVNLRRVMTEKFTTKLLKKFTFNVAIPMTLDAFFAAKTGVHVPIATGITQFGSLKLQHQFGKTQAGLPESLRPYRYAILTEKELR